MNRRWADDEKTMSRRWADDEQTMSTFLDTASIRLSPRFVMWLCVRVCLCVSVCVCMRVCVILLLLGPLRSRFFFQSTIYYDYLLSTIYYLQSTIYLKRWPSVRVCLFWQRLADDEQTMSRRYYLLFTIYYLLSTIYYLLFTSYYLLSTIYYLQSTIYLKRWPSVCFDREVALRPCKCIATEFKQVVSNTEL